MYIWTLFRSNFGERLFRGVINGLHNFLERFVIKQCLYLESNASLCLMRILIWKRLSPGCKLRFGGHCLVGLVFEDYGLRLSDSIYVGSICCIYVRIVWECFYPGNFILLSADVWRRYAVNIDISVGYVWRLCLGHTRTHGYYKLRYLSAWNQIKYY